MRFSQFSRYFHTVKRPVLAAAAAFLVLCTCACGEKAPENESSPSPSASPSAAPAEDGEKVKIATVNEIDGPLNIRSEANTECEVLGEAYTGDEFEVLTEEYSAEWVEVSYDGGKAYLFREFVTVGEELKTTADVPEDGTDEDDDAPEATPDPDAPITVNGSGRAEISKSSDDGDRAAEEITDDDPEHR